LFEPRDESLISREAREEMAPILINEFVHRFLLYHTLPVAEQVNGHQFLIGKLWLGIIAQALKTGS
jgi:hypothetical protein